MNKRSLPQAKKFKKVLLRQLDPEEAAWVIQVWRSELEQRRIRSCDNPAAISMLRDLVARKWLTRDPWNGQLSLSPETRKLLESAHENRR